MQVLTAPDPTSFCRPVFTENGVTAIARGRHPLVERTLLASGAGGGYVPNDVSLGPGSNVLLLTGPNCAGKSTYLKQTAVLVLLAHIGCYLPAASAVIRITDRICTRVSASY